MAKQDTKVSGTEILQRQLQEHRAAEEALRESEGQFRAVFEQAAVGVALVGPDGRWLRVNDKLCGIVGYSRDELLERTVQDITHPDDLQTDLEHVRRALAGEIRTYSMEKRYVRKDGAAVWVNIAVSLVLGSAGEPRYFISIIEEIGTRKKAEEKAFLLASIVESSDEAIFSKNFDITDRKHTEDLLRRSSGLLETVFASIHVLIAYMDRDFNFLRVNHAYAAADGREPEFYVGKNHFDLFPNEENEAIFRRVVETGEPYTAYAKPFVYADHPERGVTYWDWRLQPVKDAQGRTEGLILSMLNVTEQTLIRQQLQAASAYARTLIEASLDPLVTIGPDGRITDVNAATEAVTGRGRRELIGTDFSDYFTEPAKARAGYERVFREGLVRDYALEIRHRDGHTTPVLYNAAVYRDAAGRAVGVFAAARDITARKRAEEALRQLNETLEHRVAERTAQLQATNRELEAFSYSVSHDLRAPLRAIDGFSQALQEDYGERLDEQGKGYLERVRAGAQRMGQLIDDLLKLSRQTRGELRRLPVNLSELAKAIGAELQGADPERQTEFVVQEGITVEGDPHMLQIVLENLLSNAWKFTSKHQRARIEFGATRIDGAPAYFVRDDGAGFDMAYADKLFAPFQRLHAVHDFPGTGIGLAIVQRIIRRHGGIVWGEGAVEKGATFYFTLHQIPGD